MHLQQYSYSAWYQQFSQHAVKSIVIDLSPEFVEFLAEDGLTVDGANWALPQRSKPTEVVVKGVDYDPNDTYSNDGDDATDTSGGSSASATSSSSSSSRAAEELPWAERFAQLHADIESAIQQLGGQVAPKTNWSSPSDAIWLSSYNSLKCCNADQVILLLKGSVRVMHDLEQLQQVQAAEQQQQAPPQQQQATDQQQQQQRQLAGVQLPIPPSTAEDAPQYVSQEPSSQQAASASEASSSTLVQQQPSSLRADTASDWSSSSSGTVAAIKPQLVLRQWHELLPEREFRCFVHQHRLVAISQRDVSQHFHQLAATVEGQLDAIRQQLMEFHTANMQDGFPHSSYAVDVYVSSGEPVKLLDLNPITATTSPLLFSWDELPYEQMHNKYAAADAASEEQQQYQQPELQHDQAHSSAQASAEAGPGIAAVAASDAVEQQQGAAGTRFRDAGRSDNVQLRIVEHAGMIIPGARAVTGMPVDMLGLQNAFDDVMQRMMQQQS